MRLYAQNIQSAAIDGRAVLTVVVSDDDSRHHETPLLELAAESEHVFVVGDAQVLTHLVLLDVERADDNQDLGRRAELLEHPQLAVGLEAGQDAAGVIVVEKLAPQLQVKLARELRNALLNMLRLNRNVFVVVETVFHNLIYNLAVIHLPFTLQTAKVQKNEE